MHALLLLLLVLILGLFFLFPMKMPALLPCQSEEMYKNEPTKIEFPNAEFKFYK